MNKIITFALLSLLSLQAHSSVEKHGSTEHDSTKVANLKQKLESKLKEQNNLMESLKIQLDKFKEVSSKLKEVKSSEQITQVISHLEGTIEEQNHLQRKSRIDVLVLMLKNLTK